MNERTCCVVVTYNRKDLLSECLLALASQTRQLDEILVVNNASTDGTRELLEAEFPHIKTLHLSENTGGAGGFYEGLKRAFEQGFDWIWLMDDDTIPTPSAYEALQKARQRLDVNKPTVLCSQVEWTDGTPHPMNNPIIKTQDPVLLYTAAAQSLLPIRAASFVSFMVARSAVEQHGLPLKEYFIWNDDVEYSARILKDTTGYLVLESRVIHKTRAKYTPITTTGDRFYYEVRNKIFLLRSGSLSSKEIAKFSYYTLRNIARYVRVSPSPRSLGIVLRGLLKGIWGPVPRPDQVF